MNRDESLHLFTIAPWLLNNILPKELWEFIFHCKRRLEMRERSIELKDIHEGLIEINGMFITRSIIDSPSCEYIIKHNKHQGNYWLKLELSDLDWGCWELVSVNARCGVELLNWRGRDVHRHNMVSCPVFRNNDTLYEHLTENLGIDCADNLNYNDMMKLLRTV